MQPVRKIRQPAPAADTLAASRLQRCEQGQGHPWPLEITSLAAPPASKVGGQRGEQLVRPAADTFSTAKVSRTTSTTEVLRTSWHSPHTAPRASDRWAQHGGWRRCRSSGRPASTADGHESGEIEIADLARETVLLAPSLPRTLCDPVAAEMVNVARWNTTCAAAWCRLVQPASP